MYVDADKDFIDIVEKDTAAFLDKYKAKFGGIYDGNFKLINTIDNILKEEETEENKNNALFLVRWTLKTFKEFNEKLLVIYSGGCITVLYYHPAYMIQLYDDSSVYYPLYGFWVSISFYARKEGLIRPALKLLRTHFTIADIKGNFSHPYLSSSGLSQSTSFNGTCLGHSSLANLIINKSEDPISNEEELEFFIYNCYSYLKNEDSSAGPYNTMSRPMSQIEAKKSPEQQSPITILEAPINKINSIPLENIIHLYNRYISNTDNRVVELCNRFQFRKLGNGWEVINNEHNKEIIKEVIMGLLERKVTGLANNGLGKISFISLDGYNKEYIALFNQIQTYTSNDIKYFKPDASRFFLDTNYNTARFIPVVLHKVKEKEVKKDKNSPFVELHNLLKNSIITDKLICDYNIGTELASSYGENKLYKYEIDNDLII